MNYSAGYISDLTAICKSIPELESIREKSVLITGAGGLIGSAIVDFLQELNWESDYGISIYAAARNEDRLLSRFGDRADRSDFHFLEYDATKAFECRFKFDYLIHAASPANPAEYVKHPVETMQANFIGLNALLEHARSYKSRRVLYISSSEVYGKKENREPYREDEYGYLDVLNPRACYPSSKRAAETLLACYKKEYGIDYVIVRPGHIYGPTCTPVDDRAATQFFNRAVHGENIIMKSAGTQLRSYCYVLDCVSSIMTALISGENGKAYNISNPDSVCTIRELAECIAREAGQAVEYENPTDAELSGYNFMENSSLDSSSMIALGWKGCFDLENGVRHNLEAIRI